MKYKINIYVHRCKLNRCTHSLKVKHKISMCTRWLSLKYIIYMHIIFVYTWAVRERENVYLMYTLIGLYALWSYSLGTCGHIAFQS